MFSKRLKKLRIKKGLSQKALAEKIKIHQSTICDYEKNVIIPKIDVIIKLCKVLDCSSDYLLGLEDDSNDN